MHRWVIAIAMCVTASVAGAQSPCESHCHERLDACQATCRARGGDEREICWNACSVEARACSGLCAARER